MQNAILGAFLTLSLQTQKFGQFQVIWNFLSFRRRKYSPIVYISIFHRIKLVKLLLILTFWIILDGFLH